MLSGPAPLGPGASPVDRLVAFVDAYLHMALESIDLLEMSETNAPGARFRTGAYALWAAHCRILFQEAGAPDANIRVRVLLAALSAEQVRDWTRDHERNPNDLSRGLAATFPSGAGGDAGQLGRQRRRAAHSVPTKRETGRRRGFAARGGRNGGRTA